MSNSSFEYLSKDTHAKLEKELDFLVKDKRQEISKKLEESSSLGDLSENAAYQEAKEEQLMLEQRIVQLEDLLARAVILSQKRKLSAEIIVGCSVILRKKRTGEQCRFCLVASKEADPKLKKISSESPLGVALLGRKKGEQVGVLTPNGKIEYTVIEVL